MSFKWTHFLLNSRFLLLTWPYEITASFEDPSEKKGNLNPDGLNDLVFRPAPMWVHWKGDLRECFSRTTAGKIPTFFKRLHNCDCHCSCRLTSLSAVFTVETMENDEGVIYSWPGGRFEGESLAFCSQRVFTEGFDPRPSLFSLFCQPGMCAHRNTQSSFSDRPSLRS